MEKQPCSRSRVPCPLEMIVESYPMLMGMDLSVSKDEKESLSAIMWFEAPESIKSAFNFEVISMIAWRLLCCGSRCWWSLLQNISRRLMWFFSRREVASSSLFFMQVCSGWNHFPQYEHLTFSFPWFPFLLFFFEPEGSSCCCFSTLGLGVSNLVFGFFCCFPLPFIYLGHEGLIMGGSDDPHLDKLIMFTC